LLEDEEDDLQLYREEDVTRAVTEVNASLTRAVIVVPGERRAASRDTTRSESEAPIKVKRKRGRVIITPQETERDQQDPVIEVSLVFEIHLFTDFDKPIAQISTTTKPKTATPRAEVRTRSLDSQSVSYRDPPFLPSPAPSSNYGDEIVVKSGPRLLRASSAISSLPPSSPPAHLSAYFDVRPFTPSPSLSTSKLEYAPIISSPIRRIAALRGHQSVLPTPPTSVAGSYRDSSVSSTTAYYSSHKGILRRPSDFSSSSQPPSSKRIRFSLAPQSPAPPTSSDRPESSDIDPDSDDELLLRPKISTLSSSPFPHSPAYNDIASSSSPFPTEMHVRAADVGLVLGPAHTGRLPRNMLNALTPSLTGGAYTLPTPPRVIARPFRSQVTGKEVAGKESTPNGKGLMLPPPIPNSAKRSQTPISRPHTVPSPVDIVVIHELLDATTEQGSGLKRLQTPRPVVRGRSRSVSVKPAVQRISLASFPATTPRKNHRFEKELARVAREVGDEAGLEWGMDEDAGLEIGRMWREGSVVRFVA
jgi:hypothetical protein